MTAEATTSAQGTTHAPLSKEQFTELRNNFRSSSGNYKDGYLSLMLMREARWTAEQTAAFLGLDVRALNAWNQAFGNGNISALRELDPPDRA